MWDRRRAATAGPPPPPLFARRHMPGVPVPPKARMDAAHGGYDYDYNHDHDHDRDRHRQRQYHYHYHHRSSGLDDHRDDDADNADHAYLCHPDLDSSLHNALGIRNVTLKYRIHKGKAVRQTLYQDLPRLSQRDLSLSSSAPFREPPPRNPRRLQQLRRQTAVAPRPPSSVYNDDDNGADSTDDENQGDASSATIRRNAAARLMAPSTTAVEQQVSPPSSPEAAAWQHDPREENVSPIDSDVSLEEFVRKVKGSRREAPLAETARRSNIPVKRPEQPLPQLPDESPESSPEPQDTRRTLPSQQQQYPEPESRRSPGGDISRWQRIAANQQKRSSMGPAQSLTTNTAVGPYPYQPDARPPTSLGQRFREAAARSRAQSVENRPPWQGASGRESVVEPMHDDPNVAPLNLPGKLKRASGKGEGSFRNRLSHIGQSRDGSSPSAAMRKFLSSKAHKKASSMAISSPRDPYHWESSTTGAESYPSPPSEPPMQSFVQRPMQQPPSPTPLQNSSVNQIKRKPPPPAHVDQRSAHAHAHPLASSPVDLDELPIRGSPEAQPLPSPPAEKAHDWEQPPSRFSITTYATTAVDTPRMDTGSGEPSPLLPVVDPSTPVMQRGRPLPKADNIRSASNSPTSASPVQSPRGGFPQPQPNRILHSPRPSSAMSTSKPLPLAPPEVSAGDRVAHLTAQLDGLANRRININRCVKQMTELMPTDNLMASSQVQQRREDEKKKVEVLRMELAEVQREEYELGLMLHRAYKRQNREAEYEPTTLWVRRVAA